MKIKLLTLLSFIGSLGFSQTVTDVDGNSYNTVTIGNQGWITENLKTTKYNDGTQVALVTGDSSWVNLVTAGYCYYKNDSATNANIYGALYNWYAVNTAKLCPTGWRVPADEDWTVLSSYLANNGYFDMQGTVLKDSTGWNNDGNGSNNFGFKGLPGGVRFESGFGSFLSVGNTGYFWSFSEYDSGKAWMRTLSKNSSLFGKFKYEKGYGYSVRCMRDVATGIGALNSNESDISIFPNPSNGVFHVDGVIGEATLFIYDTYGSVVQSAKASPTNDVSGLANGVYNIRIVDDSGIIIKTEKVVIAH